jgi:hypothetical protein
MARIVGTQRATQDKPSPGQFAQDGMDPAWAGARRRNGNGPHAHTYTPPAKSRKHGAKAGRRKGGGSGGRH